MLETGQTVKVINKWFNVIKHDDHRAMLEIAECAGKNKKWALHTGAKKGAPVIINGKNHVLISASSHRITVTQAQIDI